MQNGAYLKEKTAPFCGAVSFGYNSLFSFKAVAAGAAFRVAAARIAHVDFTKGAVVAGAVVLAFGNAATDRSVDFVLVFIHHNKKSSFKGRNSMGNLFKDY